MHCVPTLLFVFTFLLQSAWSPVSADGYYTVIGPGTLHSNRKYNVAVAIHQATQAATLKVGILGEHYENTKTLQLQPNEPQNIEFDVPVLRNGDYNLTAEGVAGIIFKNTTKLYYEEFKPHVKIQTDKGKYKPGDVVNFRVLFLDENLKPLVPQSNTIIWVEDGKHNRIKEFNNITTVKGVYSGNLQISEYAILGKWRLSVDAGARFPTSVTFEVAKYVLPKFTVSVTAPQDVSVKQPQMQVVVRANYTYGKALDGKVTLLAGLDSFYHYNNRRNELSTPAKLILTTSMVKGKAKFDFSVKQYEHSFLDFRSATLDIVATVEEHFTGVKINGTASTRLHTDLYNINCALRSCNKYEPNKEFEMVIRVVEVDGTLVTNSKSVVKLSYNERITKRFYYKEDQERPPPTIENKVLSYEAHLNESSMAVFKVILDDLEDFDNFTHYYQVEVEFEGEKHSVANAYQIRPPKTEVSKKPEDKEMPPKPHFFAKPLYEGNAYVISKNIGDLITVLINSSLPLTYIDYNIIGRGNILLSKRVMVPDNAKLYNVTFEATFLMAPYAKFYAYYVDDKEELHYAETAVTVTIELQNPLEIAAPSEVKPGEDVALQIQTTPNSFVGLLAVDQSVLLLHSNNDIKPDDFRWRLSSFSTNTPWQGGFSRYPGQLSGVVTLTNSNYFYNRTAPAGFSRLGGAMPASFASSGIMHKTSTSNRTHTYAQRPQLDGERVQLGGTKVAPIRKDFAETWIFADIENTETAEFTWSKKIPDTITTWVLTGFSLNPTKGLGVTKSNTNILTFQPFFISVRLPYSIKRGEVINVPALIFNYLDKDLDVEVTLDNIDNEYEFTAVSNEVIDSPKRAKTVRVPAFSSAGVSFMLRPRVIGNIVLKYTANSPIAGDAVHKMLKVVPEGVTKYSNRVFFINLLNTPEFKEHFELVFPADVVTDSEHIEFSVIGDLLGPILNNLDHLIRLPSGCAEQTMSALVPNFLVYNYLKKTNKLSPAMESKIRLNLETGYQRMLQYQLKDGSFSTFFSTNAKEEQVNGSTWLTAYVVRSLLEMREIVTVDDELLQKGLNYLISTQAVNGSFVETNNFTFGAHLQDHVALTTSVVLAFIEDEKFAKDYATPVEKALKYITENVDNTTSLYAKALATYAFFKLNHERRSMTLLQLQAAQTTDGDHSWWTENEYKSGERHWWQWIYQRDVEITSYALLAKLMEAPEQVERTVPIIKWLVAQRNSFGGFGSTQNTVWGLRALLQFAAAANYQAATMDIEVLAKGAKDQHERLSVTADNGLLTQTVELPHKTLSGDVSAKGKGAALLQVAYQYNVLEDLTPAFRIVKAIKEGTPKNRLTLTVCVEYTGEGAASNMALLEVALPSGYVADVDAYDTILQVTGVRHYEFKNDNTHVVIYFERLVKHDDMPCVVLEALRQFAVARQKPAAIVVYDYYDTTRKVTDFYQVATKMCDICEEDEECLKACP